MYEKPVRRFSFDADVELEMGEYLVAVEEIGGEDLYGYVNLVPSPTLNVVFHGAVRPEVDTYPRFDRVTSLGQSGEAFLSIADPTLARCDGVLLGWYLGSSGWDPIENILRLVRAAVSASGAVEINLIGGSGGGFAAMRLGVLLDDCLIFVFNPQTVIANYNRRIVEQYASAAFPGADFAAVVEREPERFDLRSAYSSPGSRRRLFYLQHLGDGSHVAGHYRPFKREMGVLGIDGDAASGRMRFVLFDSERDGHGPPRPREFEQHMAEARRWSRSLGL